MEEFIKLFERETVATIESLIGQSPSLKKKEEETLSIISNILPPISLVKINVSGEINASIMIALSPSAFAPYNSSSLLQYLRVYP